MGPSAAVKSINQAHIAEKPAESVIFARQFLREFPPLRAALEPALNSDGARRSLIDALRPWIAAARGVRLDAVAEDLRLVQTQLRRLGTVRNLGQDDRDELDSAFERMHALLELEADREPTPTSGAVRAVRGNKDAQASTRVLLLAAREISESLTSQDWSASDGDTLTVERAADAVVAQTKLRQGHADVLVVDVRMDENRALVEQLLGDLEQESIPVVALGAFTKSEDASELLVLGVTRTIAMPHDPAELRRACLEAAPQGLNGAAPVGEVSMDGLGVRLAAELQRGLCDAVDDRVRRRMIDYGAGADILTTLWESVARIRELITAQSAGAVRFNQDGSHIAALPSAHWLNPSRPRRAADRNGGDNEARGGVEGQRLDGFTVLVAEDDPSTNWFLSGVLREAGATVIEAMDGSRALLKAYAQAPDVVLTDIVMPETSGVRVCQAIKRDVVLHATPVILLSWKNDMLQRMRELDLGADGYLLKETSAAEIVQRTAEVLRPISAIAQRLAGQQDVRGRMDALGAYALLRLVCRTRPNARLSLRDAHHLYSIEIREGQPVAASMTDEQGATLRGIKVLWTLLGVRGGRFGVKNSDIEIQAELHRSLDELLAQPIARARAAQRMLHGPSLVRIQRVELDDTHVKMRAEATPQPARGVLQALAAGTSPRDLITSGRASALLVEQVLGDAARYGAVSAIFAENGENMLETHVAQQLDILEGKRVKLSPYEAKSTSTSPIDEKAADDHRVDGHHHEDVFEDDEGATADHSPHDALFDALSDPAEPPADEQSAEAAPEEDNVFDVEDDAPVAEQTPVLATRMRGPLQQVVVLHQMPGRVALPSTPLTTDDSAHVAPAAAAPAKVATPEPAASKPASDDAAFVKPETRRELDSPRVALPSDYGTRYAKPEKAKGMSRYAVPVMFALVGLAIAITARWWREQAPPPASVLPTMQPPAQLAEPQNKQLPPAKDASKDGAAADGDKEADAPPLGGATNDLPVELPLTPKEEKKLKKGEGLLEVVVGRSDKVYVDGKLIGKGPVIKKPFPAREKPYEIKVKMRGEERVRYVVVKLGVRTRLRIAPPWTR